jgi:PAS domain S-box-containing protein
LSVEDSPEDAELLLARLRLTFGDVSLERVETEEAFRLALRAEWDVVLADHSLPGFSGLGALLALQNTGRDIPFIVVSGTLGEEHAVEAMRAGAQDFISKQSLARLCPAIARELKDAAVRRGRVRAEDLLQVTQARLSTVLESTQDRVFSFDRALRVTAVYGAWLETEQRSPDEFVGHALAELLGEAGRVHEKELRRALEGDNVVFEWSLEDGGRRRHFQTSASPLRGEVGASAGGVGVTREITRLKEMEAELLASERMVSVGTLAASVAHEINNPLACIVANLSVGAEQLPGVADQDLRALLEEVLADATSASEQVRNIVLDLRILSRGEEHDATVDVRTVLESATRLAWNQLRHRARLVRELGPVPLVWGSEVRLGQVFLNLLVNAAQATPEGNAAAHLIVLRTCVTPGGEAKVEVEDSGCGMSPEVLARLFTPFFTTKAKGVGTGLGLSISKRIVTEMQGRIEVDSRVGRGSVFRVFLPAHAAVESESVRPTASAQVVQPRRARLLVIDDDESVARAIRRVLQAQHEVVTAEGLEAVARIEGGEGFDLVLCDLMMPSITGMEVHARLSVCAPALAARMVFVTGGAFTPAAAEFLSSVGDRRIAKPFEPDELRRFVSRSLGIE